MTDPTAGHLRVVTYNIHGCVGTDGAFDPERIAAVLDELAPDIVGLQEVDTRRGVRHGVDVLQVLRRGSGMAAVFGPAMGSAHGKYGNALLSRLPILDVRHHDVSYPSREPRAVLDADLDLAPGTLRVLLTHLGLSRRERRKQFQLLRQLVRVERPRDATLILADTNAWIPLPREWREIDALMGPAPALRSFPSVLPCLKLDRIWMSPRSSLLAVETRRNRLTRLASDHLPVLAVVEL